MSDSPAAAPARGFPTSEFADRTARAQRMMAADGLSGILITTEPEVRYFTGFQTLFWQSPARPWFVFVPVDGKPIAVIPEIGAALMARTWIDDIRTWSAPAPDDDGISLLRDLLAPLARDGARIGVPKGHETHLRMPLGDYERLMSQLPGLQVADATPLIRALRMVKSPAEVEKIAHICAIASETFAMLPGLVSEGTPLIEIFRTFRRAALANGADEVPYLVGGAGQGGYADVISPPDDRPLRGGDVLMLDTGCVWDGYFCDFDRNFAIGDADEQAKAAHSVLWEATERGMEAARPGATCSDVFDAMQGVISRINPESGAVGRLGHGLGMQLTEWPSLTPDDRTELAEGMVLTLEPSVSFGDGLMLVHEENIVITAGAPRLLTARASASLPVI
ncbi:MAG: Xaa-Pro peptidase family protein [Pseudomonadota bacterium]